MTVIDFFCGAGGFSEGFRQAGFNVIMGLDNWQPAVTTHNANHNLHDKKWDISAIETPQAIEQIPDSDIIIGSPPCVSFSLSNKGGNADKTLGKKLIRNFLRIVAVKKFKPNSQLKAWAMENVPNSKNFVKPTYSFSDLNLSSWAKANNYDPSQIAITVNGEVLNAENYGCAQRRKRFICGEICKTGDSLKPQPTDSRLTVSDIQQALGSPLGDKKDKITDPNNKALSITYNELHDHHYDTGVYAVEWEKAQHLKQDHPYMGTMFFPEKLDKPSRTIMATKSASTREAILYESDLHQDTADGRYRTPTIREAASIMGFPINYQFWGDESTKWRQVGNAVCVPLAKALGQAILKQLPYRQSSPVQQEHDFTDFTYLDNPHEKIFNNPPQRNANALFREHPVKSGNMTIDLTNRALDGKSRWCVIAFVGTGEGYGRFELGADTLASARSVLEQLEPNFLEMIQADNYIHYYNSSFLDKKNEEYDFDCSNPEHPFSLVKRIGKIAQTSSEKPGIVIDDLPKDLSLIKTKMPLNQIMSIFGLLTLISPES
ncbi:DNA cytosine methyltransferase [Bifidobacterium sp. ESL0690]|uniref:DNA cytosine methyltransferase n=1 Tax=Bifidobacterium sp. ESL0690 TaxID=2983214 RepID=UPI0023F72AE3|nr:DNA cytosine methyltransferase [Bifidobacterium sp. ESL0690]WEV46368.1 DNA cytosine methyltransferase [Bifidobacterium sp. ESL0690]